MSNSNALECYLDDFYNDPNNVEEYKIIFLKNHYYPKINIFLNCEFKNFKIGIKKDRNILWFIDSNKPNNEIIYNIKKNEYFSKNKITNIMKKIYIIKCFDIEENKDEYMKINLQKHKNYFNCCTIS